MGEGPRALRRGAMPRTVNLISGPSRTADIGGQLVMGAHGPRRLCVILVDERSIDTGLLVRLPARHVCKQRCNCELQLGEPLSRMRQLLCWRRHAFGAGLALHAHERRSRSARSPAQARR